MIEFKRVNAQVRIEVSGKWPLSKNYFFYWQCNDDDFAALLAQNLESKMHIELERIRREAYNKGWKDAKDKKSAKETWFTCLWK